MYIFKKLKIFLPSRGSWVQRRQRSAGGEEEGGEQWEDEYERRLGRGIGKTRGEEEDRRGWSRMMYNMV